MSELLSLRELLGDEETLRLIEAFGGTRISVPKEMKDAHPLSKALGKETLEKLVSFYGGTYLLVPLARNWRVGIYRFEKGMTQRAIARRIGCGESMVYRVLLKQSVERDQLRLKI